MLWQSGYTKNVLNSIEALKKILLDVFPSISFSVAYLNDLKFFKEFPPVSSAPYCVHFVSLKNFLALTVHRIRVHFVSHTTSLKNTILQLSY